MGAIPHNYLVYILAPIAISIHVGKASFVLPYIKFINNYVTTEKETPLLYLPPPLRASAFLSSVAVIKATNAAHTWADKISTREKSRHNKRFFTNLQLLQIRKKIWLKPMRMPSIENERATLCANISGSTSAQCLYMRCIPEILRGSRIPCPL